MTGHRAAAGLAVALALTSALGSTPCRADVMLGDRQDGARVRVAPDAVLSVRLTANLSTGFAWRMLEPSPGLRLLSQRYDPPPALRRPVVMVGRPGVQSFRVQVSAPAGRRVALRFAYRRWWTRVGLGRVWGVTLVTAPAGR